MAKIGVVIHAPLRRQLFAPEDWERLQGLGEVVATESEQPIAVAEAGALLADCAVGVGSWRTPYPNAELMAACPHLRLWEHAAGTVRHMFGPHLEGRDLTIASCKTAIADSVAETTLAEIILGLHGILENAEANRPGPAPWPARLKTLYGATVGIVAASEVGRRVIRLLRAFPCRILLYDPFLTPAQAAEMGAEKVDDLIALCAASDAVSLHTPNLPETRHIMGLPQFAAMRDDAVFVNTSRGDCVDEDALIAELRKGRLLAILDVTSPEPAAPDSPFRALPNCFLTSHIAGPPGFNLGKQAVDDIAAFLSGGQPLCVQTADMLPYIA